MDRHASSFTVLFQPPFWVGIAERWDESGYSAARAVFGAEPTDAQLYEWIETEWHRLRFSPAAEGERPATGPAGGPCGHRGAGRQHPGPGGSKPSAGAGGTGPETGRPKPPGAGAAGKVSPAPAKKARKKAGQVKTCPAFGERGGGLLPVYLPAPWRIGERGL